MLQALDIVPSPQASVPLPVLQPNWLLMLDVDGTLLDIAHRPDAVVVPGGIKETLLRLYDTLSGALVLVSGRPIAELETLFAPLQLPAIGVHGGEMRVGKGKVVSFTFDKAAVASIAERCRVIKAEGVVIEVKPYSVALHYRLNPAAESAVRAHAQALVSELGQEWMLLSGKQMVEIKPAGFNKGTAVRRLYQRREFQNRVPIYIGDDVTDHDVFVVVQEMCGHAIKVGEPETGLAYLDSPAQVRRWLGSLAYQPNGTALQPLIKTPQPSLRRQPCKHRLVIVSNRVSLPQTAKANMGGLAVAMSAVLREHGGIWMGWSGKTGDMNLRAVRQGNVTYMLQDMPKPLYEQFYLQFCNSTLWPILHYNIGLTDFAHETYAAYQQVNRQYAEQLRSMLQPDDCVWVHDFHFIPLAKQLRALGIRNRVGFFLHTPFPSREVLLTLPVHRELMESLMSYDVVGFQTNRDLNAFRDYVTSENIPLHVEDGPERSETVTGHFPIGIQTEEFAEASRKAMASREAQDLKASLEGRRLILGIDRMDYSKGILHRMKAIDELLSGRPERAKQFTFLQITPPSREEVRQYAELRAEVESLVGHINGKHAMVDWLPIRFLARGVRRDIIAAFYRMARVCLVTPLRDGMNLVAKEFISAQDPEDPGVLVLSQFAGAAEECREALLVNPYDIHEIADAVDRALDMPLKERQERWHAMYDTISNQTLDKWCRDYLGALTGTD